MRAALAMALRLHCNVKLMRERKTGQGNANPLRLVERDAHVLDEMFDEEAGVKISFENARSEIVERPTRCRAAVDGTEHRLQVQPGLVTVEQTLAHTDHRAGNDDLVAHLGVLPGAKI